MRKTYLFQNRYALFAKTHQILSLIVYGSQPTLGHTYSCTQLHSATNSIVCTARCTVAAALRHPIFRHLLLKLDILNISTIANEIGKICMVAITAENASFKNSKLQPLLTTANALMCISICTVTLPLLWVGNRQACIRKVKNQNKTTCIYKRYVTAVSNQAATCSSGIYMYNCHCMTWPTTFRCWILRPPRTAITTADDGFLCSYNCKQLHYTQVSLCFNLILCALSVYYCPLI